MCALVLHPTHFLEGEDDGENFLFNADRSSGISLRDTWCMLTRLVDFCRFRFTIKISQSAHALFILYIARKQHSRHVSTYCLLSMLFSFFDVDIKYEFIWIPEHH